MAVVMVLLTDGGTYQLLNIVAMYVFQKLWVKSTCHT